MLATDITNHRGAAIEPMPIASGGSPARPRSLFQPSSAPTAERVYSIVRGAVFRQPETAKIASPMHFSTVLRMGEIWAVIRSWNSLRVTGARPCA